MRIMKAYRLKWTKIKSTKILNDQNKQNQSKYRPKSYLNFEFVVNFV